MAALRGTRIDLNSATATRQAWSDAFYARLQPHMRPFDWAEVERLAKEMAASPQRENGSLGARLIGDECSRRVQYEIQHAFWGTIPKRAPLDADSFRNFARGVYGEAWMCNLLCRAGFDIKRTDEDGRPFGFSAANDRIRGNIDGRIEIFPMFMHGPHPDPILQYSTVGTTPAVWEHKCVGNKSWRAIYNNGLAKAKPQYADQTTDYQYEMAKLWGDDPAPALFTAHNADTNQIYAELVEFDPERCQAVVDRAVKILRAMRARELLPRVGTDAATFPCGWRDKRTGEMTGCRFRGECWGL